MKTLHIVRGVPGSGKTTFCKKELHITPYEADDFFMVNGKYEFKPEQLAQAHKYCQTNVEWAMKSDTQYIAVANTFTRVWEMQPYLDLAEKYGYEVVIHTCEGNSYDELYYKGVFYNGYNILYDFRANCD